MMYPILCKVKFETLHLAFATKKLWIQVGFSIVMNWIIAPFLMVSSLALWCLDESRRLTYDFSSVCHGLFCLMRAVFAKA